MAAPATRIAIHLTPSTPGSRPTTSRRFPLQIKTIREYAGRRGWQVVDEIREVGSGALQRPKREDLLAAAPLYFMRNAYSIG